MNEDSEFAIEIVDESTVPLPMRRGKVSKYVAIYDAIRSLAPGQALKIPLTEDGALNSRTLRSAIYNAMSNKRSSAPIPHVSLTHDTNTNTLYCKVTPVRVRRTPKVKK